MTRRKGEMPLVPGSLFARCSKGKVPMDGNCPGGGNFALDDGCYGLVLLVFFLSLITVFGLRVRYYFSSLPWYFSVVKY